MDNDTNRLVSRNYCGYCKHLCENGFLGAYDYCICYGLPLDVMLVEECYNFESPDGRLKT